MSHLRYLGIGLLVAVLSLSATMATLHARPDPDAGIRMGATDIAGVVTSPKGPEAGVWVIATTQDLPTKYAKIVVTDDRGRYLIPDFPKADYIVWARGYGLIDSAHTNVRPGRFLNIRAQPAPSEAAAAQYYPAQYWWAMIHIPPASDFPGTGAGNGIPTAVKTQAQFVDSVKTDGCYTCHQIGNKPTRTIPALFAAPTAALSWGKRLTAGMASNVMLRTLGDQLGPRALTMFGDWTDRVKAGALPFAKPPRPQGIERNVVITEWDWASPTTYLHDAISTDKRNPTLNAYGKIYGSPEDSTDYIPVLDPVRNSATFVKAQVLDPATPDYSVTSLEVPMFPSAYWGMTKIWSSQTTMHNPMFDEQGRVWLTARLRPAPNPPYCLAGGDNPSAKAAPLAASGRQVEMYDPKTGKFALANLCFGTHHLQFSLDGRDILYFSAGGGTQNVLGWLDTKKFLATGNADASQAWTPFILADGTHGTGALYGISVSPVDGSVWGSVYQFPGKLIHVILGSNPPATAVTEIFSPPMPGYSPRGMDMDSSGVVWMPMASGQLASFDRRKCASGPQPTVKPCPEGWTYYRFPGPQFQGLDEPGSSEASYFTWVDRFNTSGLGANVPFATGNSSDSLMALVNGKYVVLRVPYPIGFFAKNLDGRIDNPKIGWKGRGLWTTYGSRLPYHMETGKGQKPIVYHFQIRPNPLAD